MLNQKGAEIKFKLKKLSDVNEINKVYNEKLHFML